MGWRYLLFILGGVTLVLWGLRFFVFTLLESPRYLIGIGKDDEAVAVIHKMSVFNSATSTLTVEALTQAGNVELKKKSIISKTSVFGLDHIKALFATRKMAFSTTLLISIWGEGS